MSLSNLNYLSQSSYFSLLYDMIKLRENPWLYAGTGYQRIHDGGGDGNPTFGYGFNLAAFPASTVEAVVLHAYGGSLSGLQNLGLDILLDWKSGTPVFVNGQSVILTNADIINMADITIDGAPGAFGSAVQRDAIQSLFLNDVQGTRILDVMLKGDLNLVHVEGPVGSFGYEAGLDYRLVEEGGVPYSTERAALLSVYYNAPSLIGPGVQNAILNDDRPQLWYEIRYNHNQYDFRGLQNRRADESDLLGLVSQVAKDDPHSHLSEYAEALDTLFNGYDRLGRRIFTQILDRDVYDPFPQATSPELSILNQFFAQAALGDPLAPAIDFVQFDRFGVDAIIDATDEAAAGIVGGKDRANTVNLILGEAGDDVIRGYGATDYLYGGAGQDVIDGGDDADFLSGDGGADTLIGGRGADTLDGGADIDAASYARSGAGVFVRLSTNVALSGHAQGDMFVSIENVIGSSHRDILIGDTGGNALFGGDGNDDLWGLQSSDTLAGENGDDLLTGAAGNDVLFGGQGDDTISGGVGGDAINGGAGEDWLTFFGAANGVFVRLDTGVGSAGQATGDTYAAIENVVLTNYRDILVGSDADNRIFANNGNDDIYGGDGNDSLMGHFGDDFLAGQAGADTLNAGPGADVVSGGAGDDLFHYWMGDGADIITDFEAGAGSDDILRISAYGAQFDTFAEVLAVAAQSGTDVVIDFGGGDVVTLRNVMLANLHEDDFFLG